MEHIGVFLDKFFEKVFAERIPPSSTSLHFGTPGYASRFIGVPTGFVDLDILTGGLQSSDLIAVAAQSDVGKTALCLSMAYHNAFLYGKRVGIFSLDLSGELIVQRLLAMGTGVEIQRLEAGFIDDNEWPAISAFLGHLSSAPIFLDDEWLDTDRLLDRVRTMTAKENVDLVIIDSLECIRGDKGALIGIASRLKQLSREIDVPIVVNFSVPPLARWMKVPILADLRADMAVEEDADIVMFIYREELYDPETEKKGIAEIHIAKHRNGPRGVVNLRFFQAIRRFVDLEIYRETA